VSVHVALLAGVNVGGNRKAPAATLKAICANLGWKRAETLLASGNIITDTGRDSAAKVATRLGDAIESALGFRTAVIVRTAEELEDALARVPYADFKPNLMLVNFLEKAPTKAGVAALADHLKGAEDYVVDGAEMFIRYESGVAGTKLTPQVIVRKLGVMGTARNVNTVAKLIDRARAMEAAKS